MIIFINAFELDFSAKYGYKLSIVWNLLVDLFLSISNISNNTFKEELIAFMFPSEKR